MKLIRYETIRRKLSSVLPNWFSGLSEKEQQYYHDWHPYFAWWPTPVSATQRRWLETIYRKGKPFGRESTYVSWGFLIRDDLFDKKMKNSETIHEQGYFPDGWARDISKPKVSGWTIYFICLVVYFFIMMIWALFF